MTQPFPMKQKWQSWGCNYVHEGETFIFEIKARSQAEAEARIASIRSSARIEGQIISTGEGTFQARETMQ